MNSDNDTPSPAPQPLPIIAHKLRTPLTVIMSTVNNLIDGAFGDLNDEQVKWLKRLVPHMAMLEQLLNDILDVLKEEKDKSALVGRKIEGVASSVPLPPSTSDGGLAGAGGAERKGTVLIVDDEPDVLDVLREGLTSHGFLTVTASNGEDAFHQAISLRPDLILMDVLLDRQNGLDVCRRIKEALQVFTPVILVTGQGDLRNRMTGSAYDADDVLMKPFHIHELFARVESVLRIKRLTDELGTLRKSVRLGNEAA